MQGYGGPSTITVNSRSVISFEIIFRQNMIYRNMRDGILSLNILPIRAAISSIETLVPQSFNHNTT